MMGFPITQEATISALHAAAPPHTAAPPLLLASDNDAFFEYGYVWLPYAIAALALFGLGAVAAVRWRRSSPGTAELLITAGALLAVLDADYRQTHPKFHEKLEAIGFGVFVPVFFVTSGLKFDVHALFGDSTTVLRVPLFLLLLLATRGLPALLYRPLVGPAKSVVAGLLQATSLPFIVAVTTIGIELNVMTRPNASALVAAGLLSVVIFPTTALTLLRRSAPPPAVKVAV